MNHKQYQINQRVHNVVVGYIADYDRRKRATECSEYDRLVLRSIDESFDTLDIGLTDIIRDDLANSVGWYQSKASAMCCHTYYCKQKQKVVRLIARKIGLL